MSAAYDNSKKMNTKILIAIIMVTVITSGISAHSVLQKPVVTKSKADGCDDVVCGEFQNSPFGIHPATPTGEAKDIGAKWTRTSSGLYLFWSLVDPGMTGDPTRFRWKGSIVDQYRGTAVFNYDAIFSRMREAGLEIMYNIDIEPRNGKEYHKRGSWLPANEQAYRAFVKEAVKRYPFVKYWQIGNEPVDRGLSDYGRFLLITSEAIKEGNPEAKVLAGGISGLRMPQSFFEYKRNFDKNYLPLLEDIGKLDKRCFDIFDFHWFGDATGDYKTAKEAFGYITEKIKKLNIPEPEEYWITEIGTYSGDPKQLRKRGDMVDWAYQTEKQQAIDLVKRYVYPLSFGIKKVFWAWGLREGFRNNEGFFDFTGLIYDGKFAYDQGKGVKKLSYYTFKKMTEILEGSDWNNIQTIQESDGVYVYGFIKNGKPIRVAWNDSTQEKQIAISGINTNQIKITEAIPKYETGKEVSDYSAAFNTKMKFAAAGKIILTLNDKPVFVEER